MNWLTKYLLNRICKQLVEQGPEHQYRITEYYKIMWNAANTEFTEDNDPSLKAFLKECHSNAFITNE